MILLADFGDDDLDCVFLKHDQLTCSLGRQLENVSASIVDAVVPDCEYFRGSEHGVSDRRRERISSAF